MLYFHRKERRKNQFWISQNIWIKPLELSSVAEEKVTRLINQFIVKPVCSVFQSLHIYLFIISIIYLFSVSGMLKGFDPLLNLVLDNTTEYMRGKPHKYVIYYMNIFDINKRCPIVSAPYCKGNKSRFFYAGFYCIQFEHVFIKLTLPPSLIYGLYRQKIRSFNRLSPKNVRSFMRVSTVS